MKNLIQTLTGQLFKLTVALFLSAVILFFYFSPYNPYLFNPLSTQFIGLVAAYTLITGFLFNSLLITVFTGTIILSYSYIYLLIYYFQDFIFWRNVFAKTTAESLLTQIAIGLIPALLILLLLRFFKLKLTVTDKLFYKIPQNKLLIFISFILLVLAVISPLLLGFAYSRSPLDLITAAGNRTANSKSVKILQTSPEQALELYLSSLETGDYENAYYAQTPASLFNEKEYFDFIDQAKEEGIQLSQPVKHTVEKNMDNTENNNQVNYLVTINREDNSSQIYRISVAKEIDKWYVKEIILARMK